MNSLSELTNRAVNELALTLLLDSGLPSVFWYKKAVKLSVYLIKMSLSNISPKSPHLRCTACQQAQDMGLQGLGNRAQGATAQGVEGEWKAWILYGSQGTASETSDIYT